MDISLIFLYDEWSWLGGNDWAVEGFWVWENEWSGVGLHC